MMNNDYNLNYSQQPFTPSNNYSSSFPPNNMDSQNKKFKIDKKIIIFIIIGLLVISGIVLFFFLKKGKDKNLENDVTYSTSFFLKNDEKKYALFNEDGTQLTDFIFDREDGFVNHSALVTKDNQYGIINENGKMTVDFGKYESIIKAGVLYHVCDDGCHYIDGNGKILYDTDHYYIRSYIGKYYSILEDRSTNTFFLLNDKAEKIFNFSIVKDAQSPLLNESDRYLSLFYHDKNYIIDKKTDKVVQSFNDSNQYCVQNGQKDGDGIIIYSCESYYPENYKYIANNKIYDITEECDSVSFDNNGSLLCSIKYDKYLLDDNFDLGIDISGKHYLNNNTYAVKNNESVSGVDFYENGKKVNTVSCKDTYDAGYAYNGIYLLTSYRSSFCNPETERYEFYKTNGEKAFNKAFHYAESFDENGLAMVSDNSDVYYLIDSNGKQVSDEYSKISFLDGYYRVVNDKLLGLLDKDGKEILPCEYSNITLSLQNHKYAKLETVDSTYIIYDIQKHKEILKTKDNPYIEAHYIIVNDSEYYTFEGKLFYES